MNPWNVITRRVQRRGAAVSSHTNWLEDWWYRRVDEARRRRYGRRPPTDAASWLVMRGEVEKEGLL